MALRVIETASLEPWAKEWDEIVAAMALPSPFLRSWWLMALTDASTVFVLVLDGERLLGGLPLERRTIAGIAVYCFVGTGALCPDHLDVVTDASHSGAVVAHLRAWSTRPGNRFFELDGVAETSTIASWLPHPAISAREAAPWQPLQSGRAQYLDGRSRSFRKTVRRAHNRFHDLGAEVCRIDSTGLESAIEHFMALQQLRTDREALLEEMPRLRRALAAGIEAGEVWLDALKAGPDCLGLSISFAACGRLSLYQTAWQLGGIADNAAMILDLAAVERAVAERFAEVDLLRGEELYKLRWADHLRSLSRVRGAHGTRARLALLGLDVAGRIYRSVVRLSATVRASVSRVRQASAGAPGS